MLAISIALNTITDHAICTIGFTAVGLALTLGFSSIPRFKHLGSLTWIGAASIVSACLIIVNELIWLEGSPSQEWIDLPLRRLVCLIMGSKQSIIRAL
jgi:predicted RND superfamily exporter protein